VLGIIKEVRNVPISQFTAFYPSRPFWACGKPDLSNLGRKGWFTDQMAEEVFSCEANSYTLKICRDGRIVLRIEALEQYPETKIEDTVRAWGEYLGFLNVFYLLLDSAMLLVARLSLFNLHEITTRDAFRVRYEGGKSVGENIAMESVASVFQMARYLSSYGQDLPLEHDPRISMRQIVPLEVFRLASTQFASVMNSPGSEKDLASFAKSLSEYKVGNYETSLILAWFIIEGAIASLWKRHLDGINCEYENGQRKINRERHDFLTGRDFTIGMTSNLLELWNILPNSLFKDIDATRGFRNKIVHKLKYAPNAADTQLAIKTAQVMIEQMWKISVVPNLDYSVVGM
jgi:hypothetical protein